MNDQNNILLGPAFKSFPPQAWNTTAQDFLKTRPRLSSFQTPILTLDRKALDHNLQSMMLWCKEVGLQLAPHGKTTMAPQLWKEQLEAGAWGITLATIWQVQFARSVGINRILMANQLIDPVGLEWVAGELLRDASFDFYCWADQIEQLELMSTVFGAAHTDRPLKVIVELGASEGRTGARTPEAAYELALAIDKAPGLQLAGVGGYEGVLSRDRTPAGLARVSAYLEALCGLHRRLNEEGLYRSSALLTVGGSAFFDLVAAHCAPVADPSGHFGTPTTVLLRSGAYLTHDSGHYAEISPFEQPGATQTLKAAIHGWTRILSNPEKDLCIIDAGKRDLPYDFDMPKPQVLLNKHREGPAADISSNQILKLNDQHGFMKGESLPIGSVVRLGLSHPCTAFDKWRLVPVIDDADQADPEVVDFVQLFF
ncbi:alanine racemase [Arthrobacter sp. H5]|uniref:alanine racemase n=1 Tax=Arthrobacter sp. H5 TaxID=1267973 RepID=UPI0004879081|nr:alanine racemase [Arthrobacter sp. H5]